MTEVVTVHDDNVTPPVRMGDGGPSASELETPAQSPEGGDPSVTPKETPAAPQDNGVWVGGKRYPDQVAANKAHEELLTSYGRQSNEIGQLRNQQPEQVKDPVGPEPDMDPLDGDSIKAHQRWESNKAVHENNLTTQQNTAQADQQRRIVETQQFLDNNPDLSVRAVKAIEQIRNSKGISYDAAVAEYKSQSAQPDAQVGAKQDAAAEVDPSLSGSGGSGAGAVTDPDKMDNAQLAIWLNTAPKAEIRKYYNG